MGYTKHQWMILLTSLAASMFCAMVYSLQAPFYPLEAEKKGIEPHEYGFVFGIYEFGIFVASFFCSTTLLHLGTKFVFIAGLFLEGGSCFLFGFLYLIDSGTIFFVYSILLRIIESFGQAGAFTAMVATCSLVFPDSVATIISLTQTFFGLGMIIGPSVGGVLYDAGGFLLPFVVVGGVLWLCTFSSYFALRFSVSHDGDNNHEQDRAGGGVLKLLKIPAVWMGILSVAVGNISIGYIQATLEPHLRQFGLSAKLLGLVFVLNGAAYSVASPLWGKICDKGVDPRMCMLIGSVFISLGFSFIGPFPFIPNTSPQLYLVIIGLTLVGIGNGGMFTPGLVCICKAAFSNGYPDNSSTYGIASGLWQTSFSIGGAVGPAVAGILFDVAGFRIGSLYVIGANFLVFICSLVPVIRSCISKRSVMDDEISGNLINEMENEDEGGLEHSQESHKIRDRVRVSSFSSV